MNYDQFITVVLYTVAVVIIASVIYNISKKKKPVRSVPVQPTPEEVAALKKWQDDFEAMTPDEKAAANAKLAESFKDLSDSLKRRRDE
jgi:hypothetical protein